VLILAGSGCGAGKTAVGCALIAAMPELRWIAVKFSPHAHEFSDTGLIWEETDRDSDKDTGRYLAAGAAQAFLAPGVEADATQTMLNAVRLARPGPHPGPRPGPRPGPHPGPHPGDALLVESNQIEPALAAQPEEPLLCLAVLAGPERDWKPSIWPRIASADALVLSGGLTPEQLSPQWRGKRTFCLPREQWITEEIRIFVRERLRV